jgi:hypothetical protein
MAPVDPATIRPGRDNRDTPKGVCPVRPASQPLNGGTWQDKCPDCPGCPAIGWEALDMTRARLPNRRPHETIGFEFRGSAYACGVRRFADGSLAELLRMMP